MKEQKKLTAFDFKPYGSCIAILLLLLLWPAAAMLPKKYGYQNGIFENLQMLVLFACCFLWLFQKKHRKLYIFAALIFFFMICSEMHFGRTLFYPHPSIPNKFLSWKRIWYAPYVTPGITVYCVLTAVFFFIGKVWKQFLELLTSTRIPVWHILLIIISSTGAVLLDRYTSHLVLEESIEFIAYTAIFATSYYYAFPPSVR